MGRVDRDAGAPVERHGDAEADRRDLLADGRARLLDGLDDRRHEAALIEPERLPADAVADGEIGADDAREELGAAEVDADHAARVARTAGMGAATIPTPDGRREAARVQGLPQPSAPAAPAASPRGRTACAELRAADAAGPASRAGLRGPPRGRRGPRLPTLPRRSAAGRPAPRAAGSRRAASSSGSRSRSSPGSRSRPSSSWSPPRSSAATSPTRSARSSDPGPYPLTGANTILVLGSDARTEGLAEPGIRRPEPRGLDHAAAASAAARTRRSRSRATRSSTSPATARTRSTPRTRSAAPALATQTVKECLGIEINHVVEVELRELPAAHRRARRRHLQGPRRALEDQRRPQNGGTTLRLKKGETELDGDQALALARTRKNLRNPSENDLTRARRQQQLVAAMKDKVTSFETFVRLPWVSWAAPKAVRSDMAGPTLLGVALASITGGGGTPQVLKPAGSVDAARRRRRPHRRRRHEAGGRRGLLRRLISRRALRTPRRRRTAPRAAARRAPAPATPPRRAQRRPLDRAPRRARTTPSVSAASTTKHRARARRPATRDRARRRRATNPGRKARKKSAVFGFEHVDEHAVAEQPARARRAVAAGPARPARGGAARARRATAGTRRPRSASAVKAAERGGDERGQARRPRRRRGPARRSRARAPRRARRRGPARRSARTTKSTDGPGTASSASVGKPRRAAACAARGHVATDDAAARPHSSSARSAATGPTQPEDPDAEADEPEDDEDDEDEDDESFLSLLFASFLSAPGLGGRVHLALALGRAVVRVVEARALEVDGDRVEHPLHRRAAVLADRDGRSLDLLHHLEEVPVLAAVLVDRHRAA